MSQISGRPSALESDCCGTQTAVHTLSDSMGKKHDGFEVYNYSPNHISDSKVRKLYAGFTLSRATSHTSFYT